jgi:prevent-host-death family protein
MSWQLQEAKSKFSRLVNQAMEDGPQVVTRHGQPVVVVLSMSEYEKMVAPSPSLVDLLLDSPLAGSGLELERDESDYGRPFPL